MVEVKQEGVIGKYKTCNIIEKPVRTGRQNGNAAKISAAVVASFIGKWTLLSTIKDYIGLANLMTYKIMDKPTHVPIPITDTFTEIFVEKENAMCLLDQSSEIGKVHSISDYHNAYMKLEKTPSGVIKKLLETLETQEAKQLNAVIYVRKDKVLEEAMLSDERYKNGAPLSAIDGVPCFVPDHAMTKGCHTRHGLQLPDLKVNDSNEYGVQKLVDAGALVVGVTNITQLSLSSIGCNPSSFHGTVRNPYNTDHYCCGACNGGACAVASGLCPFVVTVEAAGVSAISASTAGIVALKCSFGRVANTDGRRGECTFFSTGFLSSSVRDSAIVYSIMAGTNKDYKYGWSQPSIQLPTFKNSSFASIKFGFDASLTKFAMNDDVVASVTKVVELIKSLGGTVVEYVVPEMHEIISAGSSLALHDSSRLLKEILKDEIDKINCVTATVLNFVGLNTNSNEEEQCKKMKTRAIAIAKEMFEKFDIFISPSCGGVAGKIISGDERHGVLDTETAKRYMRFSVLQNFIGLPYVSINCGYSSNNLPIGVLLTSKLWSEHQVLDVAHFLEQQLSGDFKLPGVFLSPFN